MALDTIWGVQLWVSMLRGWVAWNKAGSEMERNSWKIQTARPPKVEQQIFERLNFQKMPVRMTSKNIMITFIYL